MIIVVDDPKRDKDSTCIHLQLPGKHREPVVSPSTQSDQTLTSLVAGLNKITSDVSNTIRGYSHQYKH